jgi:hypothetical protein
MIDGSSAFETFATLGNRIPEARIGDFSGRAVPNFPLSEARRRRAEKCPARGGIVIFKSLTFYEVVRYE